MNKHYLLRKISVIHAIKCSHTKLFDEAIDSFNRLNEFKEKPEALDTDIMMLIK